MVEKQAILSIALFIVKMPSPVFYFKQFSIRQDKCSMKVGTDGVLLGAWAEQSPEALQKAGSAPVKILDIGTGTGLIAIIMAQKYSRAAGPAVNFTIDAIDSDEASCLQAKENAEASGFSGKISVKHQSLLRFSENAAAHSYDLIISNPPFFHNSLKSPDNARNQARHSDFSGLSAENLVASALKLLGREGAFCLVLPKTEGESFIAGAEKTGLYCNKLTKVFPKPAKGCTRMLMQFHRYKKQLAETILTIETGKEPNDFSEEYKLLMREFYLNF